MAQTQISDLVPSEKVLGNLVTALIPAKNAFINSGVAVQDPRFTTLANGGARKVSLPYVKPLDANEFNVGIDDADDKGNTSKMQADEFTALRLDLNNGYSYTDVAQMVTQYNIRGGIQAALAQYWNTVNQKIGVASVKGALAATSASALTLGDDALPFSFDMIVDAAASAGENMDMFSTLIVHSTTYANILKSYKPILDPVTGLPRIGGYTIIVDNSFGNTKSVLVRNGALALAFGTHARPIAIQSDESGGNGNGAETLWTRLPQVVHPQGFNFVGSVPAGLSNSTASPALINALSTGTNWTMELPAEHIGIRMIEHTTAAIPSKVVHVNVDNIEDTPVAGA